MEPDAYASFLVRCWRKRTDEEQLALLRCEIEHIQSGECQRFDTVADLLAFLLHKIAQSGPIVWHSTTPTAALWATEEDHHVY